MPFSDEKHPLFDSYWASKRAPMEKINVPVFLKGSDFASMHTMGSIRAWMQIPVKEKWIKCKYFVFLRPFTPSDARGHPIQGLGTKNGRIYGQSRNPRSSCACSSTAT